MSSSDENEHIAAQWWFFLFVCFLCVSGSWLWFNPSSTDIKGRDNINPHTVLPRLRKVSVVSAACHLNHINPKFSSNQISLWQALVDYPLCCGPQLHTALLSEWARGLLPHSVLWLWAGCMARMGQCTLPAQVRAAYRTRYAITKLIIDCIVIMYITFI